MKKSKFYSIMMLICSAISGIVTISFLDSEMSILSIIFLLCSLILLAIGVNSLIEAPDKRFLSDLSNDKEAKENPKNYLCPNCGTRVSHGTKFCPECGLKFNWNK